jgi:hypothetical protein
VIEDTETPPNSNFNVEVSEHCISTEKKSQEKDWPTYGRRIGDGKKGGVPLVEMGFEGGRNQSTEVGIDGGGSRVQVMDA